MTTEPSACDDSIDLSADVAVSLVTNIVDNITVYDRYHNVPIIENDSIDTVEVALSPDGELLIRITPPEEYDQAIKRQS